jgi:hypothetical protein
MAWSHIRVHAARKGFILTAVEQAGRPTRLPGRAHNQQSIRRSVRVGDELLNITFETRGWHCLYRARIAWLERPFCGSYQVDAPDFWKASRTRPENFKEYVNHMAGNKSIDFHVRTLPLPVFPGHQK